MGTLPWVIWVSPVSSHGCLKKEMGRRRAKRCEDGSRVREMPAAGFEDRGKGP